MKQIITHFTDNDLYTFSCQYYVLMKYPRAEVKYSFIDRNNTCYPQNFAALLQEQVDLMPSVKITEEEIAFMTSHCPWLPLWYFNFLRGYTFNPKEVSIEQDAEGRLSIAVQGKWFSTIMWEMPLLSIISELIHTLKGEMETYNLEAERNKVKAKTEKFLQAGIILGDMGTRRRFSFDHQEMVIKTMAEVYNSQDWPGKFTGTSNVWLAMKYKLKALGTMSHQLISFEENVSGVFECNYNVMKKFSDVFDGDNGTYLYDCFGDEVFFKNLSKRMAMMYTGLRVDSGVEEEQTEKIIDKYKSLGIDPASKQVVYSNGLNIDRCIEIHKFCNGRVKDSYGVGTHLTCDVDNVKPSNIVIKLTKCRITETREWHDCIKLSCDKGKTLGNPDKCNYILSQI
ncbi:MAG: nicotinate phosphoribosyltransferase [Bacteroidaceae bacterium]|nr:nicotinate phosphoribosyltransferase [Bacteroidaceae bacterium]